MVTEAMIRVGSLVLQASMLGVLALFVSQSVRRLHPGVRVWIWRLIAIQFFLVLLAPPSFRLPLLPDVSAKSRYFPSEVRDVAADNPALADVTVLDNRETRSGSPASPTQSLNGFWLTVLLSIWAAGVLAGFANEVRRHRFTKHLMGTARPVTDPAVADILVDLCDTIRLPSVPSLYCWETVMSPIAVGFLNPRIILPESLLYEEDEVSLRAALLHELIHVKNHDLMWQSILTACRVFLFFSPVHWIAEREHRLAAELRADKSVISHGMDKARYGQVLLDFTPRKEARSLLAVSAASDAGFLHRRLSVLGEGKTNRFASFFAAFCCIPLIAPLGAIARTNLEQSYTVFLDTFEAEPAIDWSVRRVSKTPSGRHFLGPFASNTVELKLRELPPHRQLVIEYDLYIIGTSDGNAGPDRLIFQAGDGEVLLDSTFSNTLGSQSWPDPFRTNFVNHEAKTGASERDTLGYKGDATDSVYKMRHVIPHGNSELILRFRGLYQGGGVGEEAWGLDNVTVRLLPSES